jgi:hypothetical protein
MIGACHGFGCVLNYVDTFGRQSSIIHIALVATNLQINVVIVCECPASVYGVIIACCIGCNSVMSLVMWCLVWCCDFVVVVS